MLRFFVSIRGESDSGLAVTFDEVLRSLDALPRMFVEMDGSFVWTGEADEGPWQVDGNVVDQGDVVAYVELKGACPVEQFDALLRGFGWPRSPLAFELPRRGVVLDEVAFRQMAAGEGGAI